MFDATRANGLSGGFGQCIQSFSGAWTPANPLLPEPWQVFDLGCTYGWVHKITGARRFTHLQQTGRGNS